MKALSIRQPWAWAICHAGKDIENRTWSTAFRGPFLIHAGAKLDRDDIEDVEALGGLNVPNDLPTGGIVGRAELVDCVTRSESPWFFGRYGFLLRNAEPLPFQPVKGRLGFFYPAPFEPPVQPPSPQGNLFDFEGG
jgi:hypothetical protein